MPGHKGLAKWFKQDWVDIGSKKKGGGFAKCGRSKQKKDAKAVFYASKNKGVIKGVDKSKKKKSKKSN